MLPRVGSFVGSTDGTFDGWNVGCSWFNCSISILEVNVGGTVGRHSLQPKQDVHWHFISQGGGVSPHHFKHVTHKHFI